jgi:ribosome-interacting GTPase 1
MPANLTPAYFKAEQWYKTATTAEEKILALEQMLAVMPKHKGTDKLKADLRQKLSAIKAGEEKKHKAGGFDIFHVPKGGAGQIVLLGVPNCGKSSIVGLLTDAKVHIADFPFATNTPVPGIMHFEDVPIELVDMPPITAEFSMPGQVGTYRNCDIIAIVIDLSADVVEQWKVCLDYLETKSLVPARKTICICTKSDIVGEGAIDKIKKLCGGRFEIVAVSVESGEGMGELPKVLFDKLGIIRVYAKPPGKQPDMTEPFTIPAGSTVHDLAVKIHRELAEKLKTARIWGTGVYEGQSVQKNHVLQDKDIVELHFS